jgi:hypothetical protein
MPDTTPPMPAQTSLAVQFGHAVGGDGVLRVVIQFVTGAATTAYAIDLDKADQAADQIAEGIKAAAAQARRQRSGLIVPDMPVPDVSQLTGPNGHRH